jgi:hypothetical protein
MATIQTIRTAPRKTNYETVGLLVGLAADAAVIYAVSYGIKAASGGLDGPLFNSEY